MDASHFIAQLLGIIYTVVGIGMIVNGNRYRSLIANLDANAPYIYIGGVLALAAGFCLITFGPKHIESSVEGLICLIGWAAMIKGVLLLIYPEFVLRFSRFAANYLVIVAGISIVLGLGIGYYGFM